MVFYASKIMRVPDNSTIVMIMDCPDPGDQFCDTFAVCIQVLRREPGQTEDRQQLRAPLNDKI